MPDWYWGESSSLGIICDNQASPVATVQSCVALHLLGSMSVKRAERSGGSVRGMFWAAHEVATSLK